VTGSFAWPVAAMMLCGLATFAGAARLPARVVASLGLLVVLGGALVLFPVLAPLAPRDGRLAAGVFLACLGLFKLMNRFEAPR
jgi:hypothetical protein